MPTPANLIHETSTTTGTGSLTVVAVNGKVRFSDATYGFGTGGSDVFWYFISNQAAAEWEIGTGSMSDANTLVRDTILFSSNSNNAVDFSAGTKDVTNDVPAGNQKTTENVGWTLISQTTSPGTVSAFNFSDAAITDYTELLVVIEAMTVSGSSALRFAFSVDGGSSFLNIAYERTGGTGSNEFRNAYIETIAATANNKQGTCHVLMPPGGFKQVVAGGSRSGASNEGVMAIGTIESTAQIDYVRVTLSANNITGGNIRLYGR